jgi:hypothetical protein
MYLKFKEEIINLSAPISLIDDDYGIVLFAFDIKREVCNVLDSFLYLFFKF